MNLTNTQLHDKLMSLNLVHLYNQNKVKDIDLLRSQLKYYEFIDGLIGRYRSNKFTYYYSKINPPSEIPANYLKTIELLDVRGLKKNIKNLIIYILLFDKRTLTFKEILEKAREYSIFSPKTLYPKRVYREFAELKSFNIIISDNEVKNFEKQKFQLNISILPRFYGTDVNTIKQLMKSLFS